MSTASSQIWQSIALAIPYVVTLVVGIILALVRWQRHPAVSALLVAALGGILASAIGYRIAFPLIVANRGGAPTSSMALYMGVLGIVMALVRAVCWSGTVAAIFGWRTTPGGHHSAPLQFSIRGLIVVTFVVAVLCGLGRWLVGRLGESAPMLIQIVDDLPVIACLGIGIWIAVARWPRHPYVSFLAICAFAIGLVVTIVPQFIMIAVMMSSFRSGQFFLLMNMMTMLASSVSWALAISAALGWRSPELPRTMSVG